jgi:hypothetical protein
MRAAGRRGTANDAVLGEAERRKNMPDPFIPSNITSLADVDKANVSYEKECAVVQGIVSPSGQGGWFGRDGTYQVHCFTFAAWRHAGGPVVKSDLTILRPVALGTSLFGDFPEYSVHRISALLCVDRTRAIFEKSLPLDETDEELVGVGNDLRKPVVISTARFGDLLLDRGLNRFEGKADWNGKQISVSLDMHNATSVDSALKTAEVLWSNQSHWKRDVDDLAVKKLLSIMNNNWLEAGESPKTAAEFIDTMELESITVCANGSFSFWHKDGGMFWGHAIEVRGNVTGGLIDAGIAG